jgi:hypothetical protein
MLGRISGLLSSILRRTNSPPTPAATSNDGPLAWTNTLAWNITADYGTVLERADDWPWGMPESMLPFSREQIVGAIRVLLMTEQDEEVFTQLEAAYLSLADFLPGEDGQSVAAVTTVLEPYYSQARTSGALSRHQVAVRAADAFLKSTVGNPEWVKAMEEATRFLDIAQKLRLELHEDVLAIRRAREDRP